MTANIKILLVHLWWTSCVKDALQTVINKYDFNVVEDKTSFRGPKVLPVESKSNEQRNTPQDISYNEVNYFKLRSHKRLCFDVSIKMFFGNTNCLFGIRGRHSKQKDDCLRDNNDWRR